MREILPKVQKESLARKARGIACIPLLGILFLLGSGNHAMAALASHSLFIKEDGSLHSMGQNSYGQLGDGTTTDKTSPTQIVSSGVVQIAAGYRHSLFLKSDGSLYAMGRNDKGQLGLGAADGDAHPTAAQLATLGSGVVQVAAGFWFSAALTAGGEVYLWGRNIFGQLGNGECSTQTSSSGSTRCNCDACIGQDVAAPARVAALGTDTVQLALGQQHALALKQGGAVYSWGDGGNGALGLGDRDNRLSPSQLEVLQGDQVRLKPKHLGYARNF